jgi:eukaryotic-like serine/threonine-protein kinase
VSPAAAPGRVLGDRYRLVSPIARGGMASVWVGDDVLLSRRVAVKTLHPELALDDGLRARFRREAIAAAKLGHPDIVATYDTGEDGDVAYIVMELVDGPTLRTLLDDHGPMSVPQTLRIAREVAAALDHAHRHGVVHRDIKPANVLIPAEGPVKVTDFGIAKATGASDLTRTGTVVGTARYLAPEQVEGGTSDARTDVYAVGLLLYEMLVGRLPFGGDTEMAAAIARVTAAAPAVRTSRPEVPPEVDALVARCLERDPDQRFQDAAELAAALDAAGAAGGTPLAPPLHAGAPAPRRSSTDADSSYESSGAHASAPTAVTARPAPTDPGGPRPEIQRAAPRRRRRTGILPIVLLALLVLGAAGYLVARGLDDGNGSGGGAAGNGNANDAVQIVSAKDFDPFGTEGEHPEAVDRAIDGKPDTFWYTQTYDSPKMAKPGVGLYVVLGRTTDVRTVDVETTKAGWDAAIYVTDTPGTSLAQWGQPLAQGTDLGTHAHFTLKPATSGKAVLLWLTKLPSAAAGYALDVSEVRVG